MLPFQRENVCKGKAFFRNLQIFSKVFLKKFSEGVRLVLSRSLAHPQGKILSAASDTLFHSLSFTQSVIFSDSPSRKRLQRYRLFPFTQLLWHTFLQDFFRFLSNSLIHFMLCRIIFIAIRKRIWNPLHYIIRMYAYVCARKEKGIVLTETSGIFRHIFSLQKKRKCIWFKTQGRFTSNARTF